MYAVGLQMLGRNRMQHVTRKVVSLTRKDQSLTVRIAQGRLKLP
jgi:hypothetical protein